MSNNLPAHVEIEEALLGALLMDPGVIAFVSPLVTTEDFWVERNAWVYRAILDVQEAGKVSDYLMVGKRLERNGHLAEAGGYSQLIKLIADAYTSAYAEQWAQEIHDAAIMRRLIQVGGEIAKLGFKAGNASAALSDALQMLVDLQQKSLTGEKDGLRHIRDVAKAHLERLEWLSQHPGELSGVRTGYRQLDNMLKGFKPKQLIILAARTSVGKTAFALNLARRAARTGKSVAFFSLEMAAELIHDRLIAIEATVAKDKLQTGELTPDDWHQVMEANNALTEMPLYISDRSALSLADLRAQLKQLQLHGGVDLVIVDYLQLMQAPRAENRTQEITKLSRGLKLLASELDVPIIALSQLSRAVTQRAEKRPILSDLRESGSLEQDADTVTFLYVEEKDKKDEPEGDDSPIVGDGMVTLEIAKQREGPIGTMPLYFRRSYGRFEDVEITREQL